MSKNFNSVGKQVGHYNLCNPKEEEIQVRFYLRDDAPKFGTRGFVIKSEYESDLDDSSPLSAATTLKDIIKSHYLYYGSEKDLDAIIAYLEPLENDDAIKQAEYDLSIAEEKCEKLRKRVELLKK